MMIRVLIHAQQPWKGDVPTLVYGERLDDVPRCALTQPRG